MNSIDFRSKPNSEFSQYNTNHPAGFAAATDWRRFLQADLSDFGSAERLTSATNGNASVKERSQVRQNMQ